MPSQAGILARIAGVYRLEALFHQQDRLSKERHAENTATLDEIKDDVKETKSEVNRTNGRVDDHTVQLAVIKEAEDHAAKMQAAKVEADALVVAKRLTWRQGITFGAFGALASGIVLGILYGSGIA